MYDEKSKKDFYKAATVKLLNQINNLGLSESDKNRAIYFTKLFREIFQYDEIKKYMFITPKSKIWNLGYDSAGFCRIASVVFSVVMGVKDWQLMCINDNQWDGNASHHYLKHIPSGKFFDITYDQFAIDGYEIPYDLGHESVMNLKRGDLPWKFADALNINLIEELKKQSKGK